MVEITLYHGDCLNVMKELPDQSVDLIICDLPYGCLADGKSKNSKCSWDVRINLEAFWKEVKRIRKNNHTPCIHFCTTKFGYELIQSNPTEFRYDLVWDKQRGSSFLSSGKMPLRSHEMIYIFSKAGTYYNRVDVDAPGKITKRNEQDVSRFSASISGAFRPRSGRLMRTIEDGKKCVCSVIQSPKGSICGHHPSQKPMELYQWLIERYCPVGGVVLDPTFGSGNSLFTAYAMGRNAVGMEMDDGFFAKAEERLNNL